MKDLKIKADAGHVAWDMERFQFLDEQEEFDSIHPSLHRQSQVEQQLRPLRSHPGYLPGPRLRPLGHLLRPRQDRLDRHRSADHREKSCGPRGSCSRSTSAKVFPYRRSSISHSHGDHWGGVRGIVDEDRCAVG